MRKIILAFTALSFSFVSLPSMAATDTSAIIHAMDGNTNEWPAEKFSTDYETTIQYAIDNDARDLFVVIKVTDQQEQAKIMQMGMRLFIDMKGKHKQNLGVEFPLKKENIRSDLDGLRMMLNLDPKIKLFGFIETESLEQNPDINGSINIAFNWDSTKAMNIEWLVPLIMLEQNTPSLDQKLISIGWKINGVDEMPLTLAAGNSNPLGGSPNNGISRPSRMPGGSQPANNPGNAQMEKMMKEQMVWTKYTFTF